MKPAKEISLIILLYLPIIISSCYTQIDDKALYQYSPGEIYGCWVSDGKQSRTSTYNGVTSCYYYIENYSLWISRNYRFEIQHTIKSGEEYFHRTKGKFRIKNDTIIVSTDSFQNLIERYVFKLDGDHLYFRPVINPVDHADSTNPNNYFKMPILQYSWHRY